MAPTLTATAQAAYARVQLLLTWAGITSATIQRQDPDGTWRNVRNAEPILCGGSCAVYDHEVPLDQAVSYRAISSTGSGTESTDAFGRTVSGGWGTADSGETYVPDGGAASDYSVGSGVGQMAHTSVNMSHKPVLVISIADGEAYLSVSTPVVATGAPIAAGLVARYVDFDNYYKFVIRFNTDSTVTAVIAKRVAGVESTIASATVTGIGSYATGTLYRVHASWSGSTLRLRAWAASGSEPTTWLLTATDWTLTAAGKVGAFSRLETGNTNTLPVTISADNLLVNTFNPIASGSVTVASSGQPWLTHPGWPAYGAATEVVDISESYPQRRGVFTPIGASLPVVVSDVRGAATGTLVIQASTAADITRLRNMLAGGQPLLLRLPLTWGGTDADAWWLSIDAADASRFTRVATDGWRRWALPYVRADRPAGMSAGAVGITCDDVTATYATCDALTAAKATCTALATSVA